MPKPFSSSFKLAGSGPTLSGAIKSPVVPHHNQNDGEKKAFSSPSQTQAVCPKVQTIEEKRRPAGVGTFDVSQLNDRSALVWILPPFSSSITDSLTCLVLLIKVGFH